MPISFIVMLLISLSYVSAQLYLPSLPFITHDLHTVHTYTKLTITYYFIGLACTLLFIGPISDAIGRKKPLLIGITVGLLGALVCSTATNIHTMFIGRFVQGMGTGTAIAIARPILRDIYSGKMLAKRIAQITGIAIGSMSFAPTVGGYIQVHFGWRASFYTMCAYLFFTLISVFFMLPETNKNQSMDHLKSRNIKTNLRHLLTHRMFLTCTAAQVAFFASIVAWQTAGSIILQQRVGITPIEFGWIVTALSLIFMVGNLFNSKCLDIVNTLTLMRIGLLVGALCGLAFVAINYTGLINTHYVVTIMAFFVFAAGGMVVANSSALAFGDFEHIAGIANSTYSLIQMIGSALSSLIISYAADLSTVPLGLVIFCVQAFALTLTIKAKNKQISS